MTPGLLLRAKAALEWYEETMPKRSAKDFDFDAYRHAAGEMRSTLRAIVEHEESRPVAGDTEVSHLHQWVGTMGYHPDGIVYVCVVCSERRVGRPR